jgi:hypothetical protein
MSDHDHEAWVAAVNDVNLRAEEARQAVAARDAAIAAAVAAGVGIREVARATGLSHTGVAQIVRRVTAAA